MTRVKSEKAASGFATIALIAAALTSVPAVAQTVAGVDAATAKRVVLEQRERIFRNTRSLRNSSIGAPFKCLGGPGACVCIETNGHNGYGGMTGLHTIVARVTATAVEPFGQMLKPSACGPLTLFPELDGKS